MSKEFTPDRFQLRILGELLMNHQLYPLLPSMRIDELSKKSLPSKQEKYLQLFNENLNQLKKLDIIKLATNSIRSGERIGTRPIDVCLTTSGVFYCITNAFLFAEQQYGLTDDMPEEYSDLTYAISMKFGASSENSLPKNDRKVDLKDNQEILINLKNKLDEVLDKLNSNNEFGSKFPLERDYYSERIHELISTLREPRVFVKSVIYLGFIALAELAIKFLEFPIGIAAQEAWELLKTLLEI